MTSFGTAAPATERALGFDCNVPLTSAQIAAFATAGFTWVARYLSRGEEASHDLQPAEVMALHAHHLAVVPVQHVAVPPWSPSEALGRVLGEEAAHNASGIGCPPGVVLWLDLEGVSVRSEPHDVIAFCNIWVSEVMAAGFDAGLYVGAGCGLTSSQLYRSLTVRRYWKSLSRSSPAVDVRGFQIVQSFGATLAGVEYDRDVIVKDHLSDLPVWWAPTGE